MKDIDFRPTSYRDWLARRARGRRRVAWMGLLVVIMAVWSVVKSSEMTKALAALRVTRTAYVQDQAAATRVGSLKDELNAERVRGEVRKQVMGGVDMHAVFAELALLQPANVALNHMDVRRDDRLAPSVAREPGAERAAGPNASGVRRNVVLLGYAREDSAVAQYVHALSNSPVFEDVRLMFARPAGGIGPGTREFEVRCRLPLFE
ncbi:MAG: PilN domain-containing protein [Planctomycetes bacterium]|nr:PilN domain-containing protein [Planctomycetota bacterium]